jgi:hypothetical protein
VDFLMKKIIPSLMVTALIAVTLWACYSKRVGPAGPDGKGLTWPEMNLTQRKAHMRAVVLPLATGVFQAWRPAKYTRVDCTLCHGENAHWDDFRMPTAHIPRLSGALLLGPEFEKHPDTTRLKLDRLVPEMAEALGLKPFNLIIRRGFGCYSCHLGPDGPQFGNKA